MISIMIAYLFLWLNADSWVAEGYYLKILSGISAHDRICATILQERQAQRSTEVQTSTQQKSA